jgi:ABC-type Fe3+ transport system substrate-binding protein
LLSEGVLAVLMTHRLKFTWKLKAGLLAVLLLFCFDNRVEAQSAIGKNIDEITKLAIKEGKVRMDSSLSSDDERIVFKGFYEKYPMIKIEHTQQLGGSSTRERILTEAIGGVVGYDLVDVVSELRNMYLKAGVLAGPFDWHKLFPKVAESHFSPDGYFAGVAFGFHVLAYNPSLVPPDRVPKKWDDCLDPYWKGRFVVDTRARIFANLSRAWGEAKTIEYVTKLKNNQPIWKRSPAESLPLLAIGEFPMICGTFYQTAKQVLRRDSTAKVAVSIPTEVSTGIIETLGIMKGSKSPNAALLLAGWLASPEGQKGYDAVGKGSPFAQGSEKWELVKKAGAKVVFGGWDETQYIPPMTKKIHAAWGFK